VEREIKETGGEASSIVVDTRDVESVNRMVAKTVEVLPPTSTTYSYRITNFGIRLTATSTS